MTRCVIASGPPFFTEGKLLGVQKLNKATGRAQAEASFNLIEMWDLKELVKALVFDRTASNTGWKSGAAKILEDLLHRKVL